MADFVSNCYSQEDQIVIKKAVIDINNASQTQLKKRIYCNYITAKPGVITKSSFGI